jgi:RNA polymerase sigma-70 factor, ECF subfamily
LQKDVAPLSTDKDALLMARVAAGDLASFEELVIRNQTAAWALAFHFLLDSAEAEDVAQEAFLRLLESVHRYQPTARFRTYFNKIIVRLCLDFRSKKRPVYLENMPENAETGDNPELLLQKKETVSELKRALSNLPPTQRMAFLLRHIEGLTYSEIAAAMNISVRAVDSLLQRGRQSLSSQFRFGSI